MSWFGDFISGLSGGGGGGSSYNSGIGAPGGFLNGLTSGFGQARGYKNSNSSNSMTTPDLMSAWQSINPLQGVDFNYPVASPPAIPGSLVNPTGNKPLSLDLETDDGKWSGS